MTSRIIYIAPRKQKLRRHPFNAGWPSQGEAALTAAIIGQAVNDYVCGNVQEHDDARFFFMSEDYDYFRSLLGLADDLLPEAISDRAMEIEPTW